MAAGLTADKLKVFISYSRADTKFADELVAGLEFDGGFDITIDRHSIEKGEDWKARPAKLIEAADTIVFVLSPTSAASEICRWEVAYAAELNKRILPVLHLPLGSAEPPPALGRINYIDFTVSPTLIAGIRDLATALRTDLGWLRESTVVEPRARLGAVGQARQPPAFGAGHRRGEGVGRRQPTERAANRTPPRLYPRQ
jgi:hypothetical protein